MVMVHTSSVIVYSHTTNWATDIVTVGNHIEEAIDRIASSLDLD
jgi:hypothetical protein